MRGKGSNRCAALVFCRITPAHAGKSDVAVHLRRSVEDHPRPCGEKSAWRAERLTYVGSPPPMRGKDAEAAIDELSRRITPAHAGKSPLMLIYHFAAQDHPRPCGEKRT